MVCHLLFNADSSDSEHDTRDETDGNSDPSDDIRPTDVERRILTKQRRPRQVKLETNVKHLENYLIKGTF